MKVTPVEGIWWLRPCETCSGFSEEISIGAAHSTGWQKEAAVQPCEVNPCRAGLLTTRPHSNHRPSVCQIFSDCTFTHWESPPRQTHTQTHTRSFLLLVFLKADFTSASLLSRHINTRALNSSVSLSATPLLIFSWLQGKWTRLSNENQCYSACWPHWMFIWCILAPSWAPVWIYTLFAFTLCQDDDDTVTNLLAKIVLWRTKVRRWVQVVISP